MTNGKKFRWLDSYYNDENGLQIETKKADFVAETQKQNGSKKIRVDLYAGEMKDVAVHVAEKTKFGEITKIYAVDYEREMCEMWALAEGEIDGKLKQKMAVYYCDECMLENNKKPVLKLVESYINAEDGETKIYNENFDNFGYINEERKCSCPCCEL